MSVQRLLRDLGENIPVFFAHADSMLPAVPTGISRILPAKALDGVICVTVLPVRNYISDTVVFLLIGRRESGFAVLPVYSCFTSDLSALLPQTISGFELFLSA